MILEPNTPNLTSTVKIWAVHNYTHVPKRNIHTVIEYAREMGVLISEEPT